MDKRSITSAANGKLGGRPKKKVEPLYIDGETWKVIEDCPNYLVSNKARVFSTHNNGRILSPSNKRGYKIFGLRKDGEYKMVYLHRLVATAFVLNEYDKPEVDHIDGDKSNNHPANLRWVTSGENSRGYNAPRKGKSKYRGVCWQKERKKWAVEIMKDRKKYRLGHFDSEIEAAKVWNEKAIELGFSKEALNAV